MTIRYSMDEGETWASSHTVWPGPSAYSDLVQLRDGRIGLLFEGGHESPYEGIAFATLPEPLR